MSMKYYLYLSDTKVDMLYSQIPKNILDKIAVELGINLGIFSLTAKGKGNQEQSRYEKLRVVVNYIENNMDVGTIDQPREYFKGSLPMRWSRISEGLVYFVGETAETILGLGGSVRHVIGDLGGESRQWAGNSSLPSILEVLKRKFGSSPEEDLEALNVIATSLFNFGGPQQHLEFLSKRLIEGSISEEWYVSLAHKKSHTILGAPIYVAMVD
jgi:hypothetical protein